MTLPQDALLKFQEELAALDKKDKANKAASSNERMRLAREEFDALRERYQLTLADAVAFFPEEEGIEYLRGLIDTAQNKPKRGRKPKSPPA